MPITMIQPDLSMRPFHLAVEHTFDAAPEMVYWAFTMDLDKWFAEPGTLLMRAEVNEPFFFETVHLGERYPHYGRFIRLEPPRVIEMSWVSGPAGTSGVETVLTLELSANGAGTDLRLRHEGFLNEAAAQKHEEAWPVILEKLDQLFRRPW